MGDLIYLDDYRRKSKNKETLILDSLSPMSDEVAKALSNLVQQSIMSLNSQKSRKRTKRTKLGCTIPGCPGWAFTKLCLKHWRMKHGYEEVTMGRSPEAPLGVIRAIVIGVVLWILAVWFLRFMS